MPSAVDILQFFRGQLFQNPTLPNTSFSGKVVVITGGNTGLGLECAKHLAHLEASKIVIGCRDVQKGAVARKEILASGKGSTLVDVWKVDMADYTSVKVFCERISNELPRLDAVVANAGISTNEYHSAEGLESTLTVNVVSTFLMALLVLPKLKQTAIQNGSPTHFTVTGSVVHCFAEDQQLRELSPGQVFQTLSDKTHADMAGRYYLSKLMVLQCIQQMAMRIPKQPKSTGPMVIVNCPSPGWCKTGLFRQDDGGFWGRNLLKAIGRTGELGARTITSAIAAGDETHGHYLSECQVKPASVFVRSPEGQQVETMVWKDLLRLLDSISPGVVDNLA